MKAKACIILSIVAVGVLLWGISGVAQEKTKVDLKSLYATVIDDCIGKCQSKVCMLSSRSKNIRRAAVLACVKSAFFKNYKDELIAYLLEKDVGTNPFRIYYHLNRRFFNVIRPDETYRLAYANQ